MSIAQLPLPDFIRPSARAAKRAAVALLVSSGLLIDVFAGFGGGSIASERAHGRPVNIAINHWPSAIEYHTRNHPEPTRHLTSDIREVDPLETCGDFPVLHAHFSPDCRHFSSAKGGQPVSDKVRALPWVILTWAKQVRPTLITMENVKEFLTWGPTTPALKDGQIQYWPDGTMKRVPVKEKKGQTFKSWLGRLKAMGYQVDWKILDAADFGAPTHRKRLFLVARCDGKPVTWPEPTHGQGLKPYRTAAECIDFDRPCPSIFMDRTEARQFKQDWGIQCQRPLKPKTLWRIANGIRRYVIEAAKPFIVQTGYGERRGQAARVNDVDAPLGTIVGANKRGVVAPAIAKYYSSGDGKDGQGAAEPLDTITTQDRFGLIGANLVRANHGSAVGEMRGQSVEKPLGTVTQKHGYGVVASHMIKFRGDSPGTPADAPLPTVTAGQGAARDAGAAHALGVSSAVLVEVQNASNESGARAVDRPGPTIMGNPKGGGWALAGAVLKHYGGVTGQEVEKPLGTITTVDHHGLAAAHITHFHTEKSGETRASDPTEPLPTQDTSNRFGIAAAFLAKLRGSGGWKPADLPLDTVCAGAPTFAHVSAFLVKMYGTSKAADILKPLGTVTAGAGGGHMGMVHAILSQGVDDSALAGFYRVYAFLIEQLGKDAPLPLIKVDGHLYLIVDIGMRMLEPRELLNAQFTPELARDYVLPKNKSLAVKLIGNSVSPPVLEAVIRAQGIVKPLRRAA
jgi:DNA (cytosine-5)-methyltransferase 1